MQRKLLGLLGVILISQPAVAGKVIVFDPSDPIVPGRAVIRKETPQDWRNPNVLTFDDPPNGQPLVEITQLTASEKVAEQAYQGDNNLPRPVVVSNPLEGVLPAGDRIKVVGKTVVPWTQAESNAWDAAVAAKSADRKDAELKSVVTDSTFRMIMAVLVEIGNKPITRASVAAAVKRVAEDRSNEFRD